MNKKTNKTIHLGITIDGIEGIFDTATVQSTTYKHIKNYKSLGKLGVEGVDYIVLGSKILIKRK